METRQQLLESGHLLIGGDGRPHVMEPLLLGIIPSFSRLRIDGKINLQGFGKGRQVSKHEHMDGVMAWGCFKENMLAAK